MADKSKAEEIKAEVAAYLEEQRLYFKKLKTYKELTDERLRREAREWDDKDKEAYAIQ